MLHSTNASAIRVICYVCLLQEANEEGEENAVILIGVKGIGVVSGHLYWKIVHPGSLRMHYDAK